jgi:hypothetical protein
MQKPYRVSCPCGDIRFEVDVPLAELIECNGSTCRRSVRLLTEKRSLTAYGWLGLTERRHFCPRCGSALLGAGYPDDHVSVNASRIGDIDAFALEIERFDGRNAMPPGPRP